jgi:hypothetical protein
VAAHRRAARSEWSTAQILSAYRGLSHVEAVFRNLKDPGMFATHPQFHWTDQKLHLHAFMCDTAYLLVRLSWRAREAASFSGSLRNLLSELSQIRLRRLLDHTGRAGRPRLRRQLVGADGGPLIYNSSEEEQRPLDSTCRKLHRFLNQPQR